MRLTKEVKDSIDNWFNQKSKEEIEYVFNKYSDQLLTKEEKSLLEDSLMCLIDKKNKYLYKHREDERLIDKICGELNQLRTLFNKVKMQ